MSGHRPAPGALSRLLLRNTAANFLLRLVSVGVALAATAALIHGYGATGFALVAVALQVASLAALLLPGVPGALVREVAAATGRDDPAGAARLATAAARLYGAAGLVLGTAITAFGLLGGMGAFRFPAAVLDQGKTLLVLAGPLVAVRWGFASWADTLAGLQEYPRLALVRAAAGLATAAGVLAVALAHLPLPLVLAVHLAARLGEGLAFRRMARRFLPAVSLPWRDSPRALRPLFAVGRGLAVLELAGILHDRVDTLVLAALASAPAVAACQVTVRLHNLVRELQGTLSSALAPLVAREHAGGNEAALEQALYRGSRFNLLVILPVVVPASLLAGDFLRLWLGPEWSRWGPLAGVFVGYWALGSLTAFAGQVAVGTARLGSLAAIAAGTALLNLGLSVRLAPRYGVTGVLGASLFAWLLALVLQFLLVFPRIGVRRSRFFREVVLRVYPPAAAAAGLLAFLQRTVPPPGGFPGLVLRGAFGGLAVLAVLLPTATDPRDRRMLLDMVRGILRRSPARGKDPAGLPAGPGERARNGASPATERSSPSSTRR